MGEDGGSCGGVYEMIRRTDYQQSDIDLEVPLISIIVPVYQVKDYIGR